MCVPRRESLPEPIALRSYAIWSDKDHTRGAQSFSGDLLTFSDAFHI